MYLDIHFIDGLRYLKPYLLESSSRDVRQNFSQLLEKTLSSHVKHSGTSESNAINAIVNHLVDMLVR